MIKKRLVEDPYGSDVWLFVGSSAEITAVLDRRFHDEMPPDARAYHTCYPSSKSSDGEVHVVCVSTDRTKDKLDRICVAAHECVHLTFDILEKRGIACDSENDEPFAYYHEWLFRQCAAEIL